MPTITTTVTSACSSGAVVTNTTTEATPDSGGNADVELIKASIAEWGAGTGAANKAKYYHENYTIDAGPGKVPGWGQYTYDTFDQWMTEFAQYDFSDMGWEFYAKPGGVVGEMTCSMTRKSDGVTVGPLHVVSIWTMEGGKATHLKIIQNDAAVEQAFSSANADVEHIKAAIGEWGAGTYAANKAKYYHEGATIDAGPGKVAGWGQYTYATIDQWMTDLVQYDFTDMGWEFYAKPGGVVGEMTCSMTRKSDGATTGPLHVTSIWTMEGGKATNLKIIHDRDISF